MKIIFPSFGKTALQFTLMAILFIWLLWLSYGKLSCGMNNLVREEARKAIQDTLLKKYVVTEYIGLKEQVVTEYIGRFEEQKFPSKEFNEPFRRLVNKGLLNATSSREENDDSFFKKIKYVYVFSFTEQAEPFLLKKNEKGATVKLADLVITDITGVTDPSNPSYGPVVSKVSFEYKHEPTPFGEVLLDSQTLESIKDGTATFILYDSGWRLKYLEWNN